ncbi:MAG: hypothetical protein ACFFCH_02330 [Promethearchaeota archaeon]
MPRRYKVVQCPHCLGYTYIPVGVHRNSCPRCRKKLALHTLPGTIVVSLIEAQKQVQQKQNAFHRPRLPETGFRPAEQVLQLLRSYHSDISKWLPIHELFQRSIEAGLLPKEVQEAIEILQASGFLEKREDTIRAIPLN